MPRPLVSVLLLTLSTITAAFSQTLPVIRIETRNNLLLLSTNKENQLKQVYYGRQRLAETLPQASNYSETVYSAYGMGQEAREVALRLTHSDGNLTSQLVYVDH